MKRIFASIFIFSVIGLISAIRAQGVEDALRYSFNGIGGTARYVSMGGSMGALGGDVSMLNDNPGGIGVFRTSQFVTTPTLSSTNIESNYFGVASSDNRFRFNFNNFGYIQTFDFQRDRGLSTFSFALTYNRINDFFSNQFITGTNTNNSMADYFAYTADGNVPENLYPFSEGLAYWGWVIDPDTINWDYRSSFEDPSDPNHYSRNMSQTRSIQTDGRINEWNLTFGSNISNKVFIGINFGINDINYYEYWEHSEQPVNNQQRSILNGFAYSNELNVDGFGFNFKGGVIYKPIDFLRIGVAVHTPTWYTISESYINYIASDSTSPYVYDPIYYDSYYGWQPTGYGVNDWAVNTPFKFLGSLGFQFGKYGLLNFDYEYNDYTWIKTKDKNNSSSGEAYFRDLNSSIDNSLKVSHTLKAGGEVKLGIVAIRQGFAYYTNPWTDNSLHSNFQQYMYSGGIGVRLQRFTADFAFAWTHKQDSYVLYNYPDEVTFEPAVADVTYNNFRYMLTLGIKL
jgi:hypothetical protein